MLNFFTAKTPNLYILFKFTNFAAAVFFFAGICFAAINVTTANNAEIANFIENESKMILQIPDSLTLTINFQTGKDEHVRAWPLFFWGKRKVSIKADYTLDIPGKGTIKNSLKADSSLYTGYCGVIECPNKPMPAQQRIETLKYLVSKILTELNSKIYLIFAEKKAIAIDSATVNPITVDSTTKDTTSVQDSVQEQK